MDWDWAFAEQKRHGWAMIRAAMWLALAFTHFLICARQSPNSISLIGVVSVIDMGVLYCNFCAKTRAFDDFCKTVAAQAEAADA